MATATAPTQAVQNGDAAFKAAASAAQDFARTASEAFAPTVEKATAQAQEYVDATFAQAKKSAVALLDAFDAGLATTIELQRELAAITDVDVVKDVVARATELVSQAGEAYSKAARELLK